MKDIVSGCWGCLSVGMVIVITGSRYGGISVK